jgi:hypothetical protein
MFKCRQRQQNYGRYLKITNPRPTNLRPSFLLEHELLEPSYHGNVELDNRPTSTFLELLYVKHLFYFDKII